MFLQIGGNPALPERRRMPERVPGASCLTGIARGVCILALLALLASALSPADDSLQQDFSRWVSSRHSVTATCGPAGLGRLAKLNRAAVPTAFGADTNPLFHFSDHALTAGNARKVTPGVRRANPGRAPPRALCAA